MPPPSPKFIPFLNSRQTHVDREQIRAAMEEGGVDLVLSRAVELRLKITNCIHKSSINTINNSNGGGESVSSKDNKLEKEGLEEGTILNGLKPNSHSLDNGSHNKEEDYGVDDEDEDADAERLLHIRDALESLEHQLSNLQALQQQQRYEREVALSEIEHSRKMLLNKLKEYKGAYLEVIQEASRFACETVEHSNDLLLTPYPSRPPPSLVIDNHYLSHKRNGVISAEAKKNLNHSNSKQADDISKNSRKGFGYFIGAAAKSMITLVGVISVLRMSGFGPKLGKRSLPVKIMELFPQPASEEKSRRDCPPGRVLVVENGEARCVVKERVAVPFAAVVAKPDVDFGCG